MWGWLVILLIFSFSSSGGYILQKTFSKNWKHGHFFKIMVSNFNILKDNLFNMNWMKTLAWWSNWHSSFARVSVTFDAPQITRNSNGNQAKNYPKMLILSFNLTQIPFSICPPHECPRHESWKMSAIYFTW